MKPISIVIPVHPPHFKFLRHIIHNIYDSTDYDVLIEEIIIACSEVDDIDKFKSTYIEELDCNCNQIVISNIYDKANASTNRNRGWKISNGKYVFFMDADDVYHLDRFKIIYNIFEKYQCDSIIHGYFNNQSSDMKGDFSNIDNDHIEIVESITIFNEVFPTNKPMLKGTNCGTPKVPGHIAQGHACIKKNIYNNIQYNENMRVGEDGKILRDILYNNKNNGVLYIKEELSKINSLYVNSKNLSSILKIHS